MEVLQHPPSLQWNFAACWSQNYFMGPYIKFAIETSELFNLIS